MFFEKLHDDAILPTVGTTKSAGHDLYVYDDEVRVPALETAVIHTGVRFSEDFNKYKAYLPQQGAKIPNRIQFAPYGKIEIKIEPRSGLAAKHDLDAKLIKESEFLDLCSANIEGRREEIEIILKRFAGVCDQDYTEEIMVLIHNLHPTQDYTFKKGDKCAQMIFNVGLVDLDCVQNVERDGGFGSTGA